MYTDNEGNAKSKLKDFNISPHYYSQKIQIYI